MGRSVSHTKCFEASFALEAQSVVPVEAGAGGWGVSFEANMGAVRRRLQEINCCDPWRQPTAAIMDDPSASEFLPLYPMLEPSIFMLILLETGH